MKCSFCNKIISKGTGKMFVRNTGEIFHWCSSKCEKSYRMDRVSKKLKWVRSK